jgi:hypothetical protein
MMILQSKNKNMEIWNKKMHIMMIQALEEISINKSLNNHNIEAKNMKKQI